MQSMRGNHTSKREYESSIGLRIACFLVPLIGLIVYAVNIVERPKIAKECGKFAIYGFIVALVITLITYILPLIYKYREGKGLITTVKTTNKYEEDEEFKEMQMNVERYLEELIESEYKENY